MTVPEKGITKKFETSSMNTFIGPPLFHELEVFQPQEMHSFEIQINN